MALRVMGSKELLKCRAQAVGNPTLNRGGVLKDNVGSTQGILNDVTSTSHLKEA